MLNLERPKIRKYYAEGWRGGIVFLLSLFVIGLVYQIPVTYTVNLGQASDEWEVGRGFGDREQNSNFSFRWTVQSSAEMRLPDVGWPSTVGLVGLAPRPDNTAPYVTLTTDKIFPFIFNSTATRQPPAPDGRLTFEVAGPNPHFRLNPDLLLISSDLFQPKGDPRNLGLVVSQVYIKAHPNRFGFIVPPLSGWLGWAVLVSLLYFGVSRSISTTLLAGHKGSNIIKTVGRVPRARTNSFNLSRPGIGSNVEEIQATRLSYKILPYLVAGGGLALVAGLLLGFPGWAAVNGVSLAWGLAFPVGVWLVGRRYYALALLVQLAFGVWLVFYGLAPASFTLVQFGATAGLLLVLGWRHQFSSHLENVGLVVSSTGPFGWFLWQGQLPRGVDLITYHLPWINELDVLIRQGNFYPRWTPNFVWQQGWAIFNYYPPGARYLPEILHLSGLSFNNGVLLAAYAATVFATVGCYWWCQEILGEGRAAVVGAVAFCYLPYRFVDIFSSGALANFLGGAILPWVVWLITCLVRKPLKARYVIGLGLCGALLAVTSTPQLLVFLPMVAVYVPGLVIIEARKGRLNWRKSGGGLGTATGLALGLSAFYLLPATFEINEVGLKFAKADLSDGSRFWANASSPFDLWHPIFVSLGSVNSFATLPFWLAAAGLIVLMVYRPGLRWEAALLGLVVGWAIFLQFPVSRFFWQTFTGLTTVQFTSRLLYSAIIFAAPLIGGLALSFKAKWSRVASAITGLAALGLMFYACFYALDVRYWPQSFDGTISRQSLIEQVNNADVMYLPKGADLDAVVNFTRPKAEDGRALELGEQLAWQLTGTDSYRLRVNLKRATAVSVPLFWFEAWWKVQDEQGREYKTGPASGTGHVQLDLPPGEYALSVKLQDTPIRSGANGLSLLTLLGLVGFGGYWFGKRRLQKG